MSFDLSLVSNDDNSMYGSSMSSSYRHDAYMDSTVMYTSSLVVNLHQFQSDLYAQHQQEQHALTELNERFRRFVDRVRQLEAQNANYLAQLAHHPRQLSGSMAVERRESYEHSQSDITTAKGGQLNFELEFEMFQLQIAIYHQLIETEQQWKTERRSKLEQELNQSSSSLSTLNASYMELSRNVENLYITRTDASQQYLKLTSEWTRSKRTTKEWQLAIQTLRNHLAFYSNFQTSSLWSYESSSVESFDVDQFWKLQLEASVKKIRYDFEQLYATIGKEMTAHYAAKIEEAEVEVIQEFKYQKVEYDQFEISQQTVQIEYEKVQKSYSYEQEVYLQLEGSFSKLELQFQSIQHQYEEQLEVYATKIQSLQESILTVAYDIEDMRKSKINLESEIIIYRHLLVDIEIQEQQMILTTPEPASIRTDRKLKVKIQKKGSIAIKECPPDGSYIGLMNDSNTENVDISRWVIRRRVDSQTELRYTLPAQIRVPPGGQVRINSKSAKSSSHSRTVSSSSRQELVSNDVVSWGSGATIKTILSNQNGEERALYSQSISTEEDI